MGFTPRFILGVFFIGLQLCHQSHAASFWRHVRQAHPPEEISNIEDAEIANQLAKSLEKINSVYNDSTTIRNQATTLVAERKPKTENISNSVPTVKSSEKTIDEQMKHDDSRPNSTIIDGGKTEVLKTSVNNNVLNLSSNSNDSSRNVNARAIDVDISKYLSEEFHNKNNIYTVSISPDTEKYTNDQNAWSSTFDQVKPVIRESTTKPSYNFDKAFKSIENSVKQKLEYIDDEFPSNTKDDFIKPTTDDFNVSALIANTKSSDNSTEVNLTYTKYRNLTSNSNKIRNKVHQDVETNSGRNLVYNSSYITTTDASNDMGDKNDVLTETNNIVRNYSSHSYTTESTTTNKNVNQIDASIESQQADSRFKKTKNESSIEKSLISNKIETDLLGVDDKLKRRNLYNSTKPLSKENSIVAPTFSDVTEDVPRRGSVKYQDTLTTTSVGFQKEDAANSISEMTNFKSSEPSVQENQVYHVQIPAPDEQTDSHLNDTLTTVHTSPESTISTTLESDENSTTSDSSNNTTYLLISTTTEESTSTENTQTEVYLTESQRSSKNTKFDDTTTEVFIDNTNTYDTTVNTEPFTEETYSTENTDVIDTTLTDNESSTTDTTLFTTSTSHKTIDTSVTSPDDNYQSDQTTSIIVDSTTDKKYETTTNTEFVSSSNTHEYTTTEDSSTMGFTTTESPTTNSEAITTSSYPNRNFTKGLNTPAIIVNANFSEESSERSNSPSSTHRIIKPETTSEDMPLIISLNTSMVGFSTPSPTENMESNTEPLESSSGKTAAIIISTIGAICLIALAILLFIMRKRHKHFTYGQRCTPVGLDAYSVDNVSVYNSVRRKAAARASKRSYGNPAFDDPDVTSHPMNFPALAKFADNKDAIVKEFEEIPQINAQMSELPEGCEVKNRYANVIPLPETRVFLSPIEGHPNSDYINANYVTGAKGSKRYYIACQAPMQSTVDDFWKMIWEQQSRVILMLTNLFENGIEKCVDYLPPSEVLDCHRSFGDFHITLKKREVKEKYIISTLHLKNMVSNSWREVTHLWYLEWPEKGVPSEANSIIAFLIEARSYIKPISSPENGMMSNIGSDKVGNGSLASHQGPVVVHCSPGTGRTGTVIACDIAIREFELAREVDIPKSVYNIRRGRASSVQTKEQYGFIYQVITLYATKLTGGVLDSL